MIGTTKTKPIEKKADNEGLTACSLWEELFSPRNVQQVFKDKIRNRSGAGVDRITVARFEKDLVIQSEIISRKCVGGTYKFSPYLEQLASKGRKSPPRVISIPTVRDKIVLKIIAQYIHASFNSLVARDLPNTVIRKIKDQMSRAENLNFIKLDIKGFYDSIDHEILFSTIFRTNNHAPFLRLLKRAVSNPTLPANYSKKVRVETRNTKGVPQGLSISNILAEIYIAPFDADLRPRCNFYNRFVDDVLLFCSTETCRPIWTAISNNLSGLRLERNPQKSTPENQSVSLRDGIDFLGYSFSPQGVSVRESSYHRFVHSMLAKITKYKHGSAFKNIEEPERKKAAFIQDLNERITGAIDGRRRYGWVFFFSEVSDLGLLHQIDRVICEALGRVSVLSVQDVQKIKKVTRAYFEAKHTPDRGYIHSYNAYQTSADKLQYLLLIGWIKLDQNATYNDDQIDLWFDQAKAANLLKLERDVGMFS